MPELPDITVYCESLATRISGATLARVHLGNPFVLRTVDPPVDALHGRVVRVVKRLNKRIVIGFDGDDALYAVLHLMIAGRLAWKAPGAKVPAKGPLLRFEFDTGTLLLTEAGTKRRASLHVVSGTDGIAPFNRGGLEVQGATLADFRAALSVENHTLKRALTDPRLLSGIGNAYSDEILHRAKASPFKQTRTLEEGDWKALFDATVTVLDEWTARMRTETGDGFPKKVTAFRPEMAVHGKYGQPCPVCETAVARIRYAENECNYCPRCQTGGRLLADRALSRLLKANWPKTVDELEKL